VDFEHGSERFGKPTRSEQPDFYRLAGFRDVQELRDPQTGAIERRWSVREDAGFINDYSRSNPMEKFAELLATYRVDGDLARRSISPELYRFTGEHYFHDQDFSSPELLRQWAKEQSQLRGQELLRGVIGCQESGYPDYCLDQHLSSLIAEAQGSIRSQKPEGCRTLAQLPQRASLTQHIRDEFTKILRQYKTLAPEALRELEQNYAEALSPSRAYQAYLVCQQATEARSCFDEKLNESSELYQLMYPFERAEEEANSFYQTLLASNEDLVLNQARELWNRCLTPRGDDRFPPRMGRFMLTQGYLVSSAYNCINDNFPALLRGSLAGLQFSGGRINDAVELQHVEKLLQGRLVTFLRERHRAETEKELFQVRHYVNTMGDRVRDIMIRNRSWVPRGSRDPQLIHQRCVAESINVIGHDVKFHIKREVYRDFLESVVCLNIHQRL
jgi:hypothetical protein